MMNPVLAQSAVRAVIKVDRMGNGHSRSQMVNFRTSIKFLIDFGNGQTSFFFFMMGKESNNMGLAVI